MIGLDTNLLIRYIVQDDPPQAAQATALIEAQCSRETPGWIDTITLCELVWVLESAYDYGRSVVADVLRQILGTAELSVENSDQAWASLRTYRTGNADFADYLMGLRNHAHGCSTTWTFDKRAARSPWHQLLTQ
ncbi:type II toxin-antitoxin system VapC family toxin [Acidithiobacillus sp. MC6.1]|nr:type II toxin-antitoxin system VapC family toxin [Acidithiobacillus sp. MC6.1]